MCFRDETLWDWYCVSQSLLGFFRLRPLSGLYFTISTNVSMEPLVKCMLMRAWHALSSLFYHILRIRRPPAEFSARISAVHAETGMRRYNDRSAVIIPYPSDMLFSPRDAHSPQWCFGSLRAPAARRRYNACSAVIIPYPADMQPPSEHSARFQQ